MLLKSVLILLTLLFFSPFYAQTIRYDLKMEKPESHYFQVEMSIENWKKSELELHMPVWAPGSYLVREFSKNVNLVKAFDEKNNSLEVEKTSKNQWLVKNGKAKNIKIKYEVFAFELSVRTSYLDFTHGFVSGSGVFMFVPQLINDPGTLSIHPHSYFQKISTGLPKANEAESSDKSFQFQFENYDQLVDCPIEIGNQEEFSFMAAGVKHNVAIYGEGNYDTETLKEDMKIIVENATKVFGENPNEEYTFIIHNVLNGQGGLEHANSTTLSVNRWTYQGSEYLDFLSLVAHEYFHLWNVKRIRPIELGPFDYDKENYTTLLWVMEGFTSYYDELLLLRSGYYTQEQYIQKLAGSLNYVEGSAGARVQPLSHASYDAWIKAYRPTENSSNTTMTYYSRGQLIAAIFDAIIVFETKGQYCLDEFLKALYTKYYKKLNRGFTVAEFKAEMEKWSNQDLTEFWKMYIDGTEIPDYKVYFSRVGLNVEYVGENLPSFGAKFTDKNGKTIVQTVRSNSSAEKANLSPGDEVIAVEGFRVNTALLNELLEGVKIGETFKMLIARDEVLFELAVEIYGYEQPKFSLSAITTSMEKMLRDFWLR